MTGGIGSIEPTGLNRDGVARSGERAPVGGTVDTERGARYHGTTAVSEPIAELGGHMLPVPGGRPGPHHRHCPHCELVQAASA